MFLFGSPVKFYRFSNKIDDKEDLQSARRIVVLKCLKQWLLCVYLIGNLFERDLAARFYLWCGHTPLNKGTLYQTPERVRTELW